MGRLWWAKVAGAVGPATVVVANIFSEHCAQMPLIEYQDSVSEFSSEGSNEPFGKTVRSWAPWRDPDYLDAHIGQDGVE